MASVMRFFRKRQSISLASKIGGDFLFLLAAFSQVFFGYYFIRNNSRDFPTRAEAVARVAEETGLR
jgi:hypothetical protein